MDSVPEKREANSFRIWLSFGKRLSYVADKFHVNFGRHRRLKGVDTDFNYGRPFFGHRLAHDRLNFPRFSYRVSHSPARARERGKVNGREFNCVLRVSKKSHLFPSDHSKGVVLDHDDLDR